MGFRETVAAVMLGNILAATVVLIIVKNWTKADRDWSWWAIGGILGPTAYFLLAVIAR